MTDLDWPAGFERTDPTDREANSPFRVTLADTAADIRTEMDRLGADGWRASTASGGAHTKGTGLPKHSANPDDPGFVLRWTSGDEDFAVACDAYADLRDNVRTVYLWVHETRMRSQRPVETGSAEFAAARLPSGEGGVVVAREAPHEVLGIGADASEAEIRSAYREAMKDAHPDTENGSREAFDRITDARDELLGGGS